LHGIDIIYPGRVYFFKNGFSGEVDLLSDKLKENVSARLRRVEGQVAGIRRMIEENRYCVDILTQTSAAVSALRRVEDVVMENHLNTCVADAMGSNDPILKQEKTVEIMDVIARFRKHG
jgi:DNA-binding FrmR family transcriptional regulator